MTCHYCRFSNTGEDHRCQRCGRRLAGQVEPTPSITAQAGANALAPQTLDAPPVSKPAAERRSSNPQTSLFSEAPNVIPFGSSRKASATPEPLTDLVEPTLEIPRPVVPRAVSRKPRTQPAVDNLQSALNFQSAGTQSARMLKTTVEAVIYCDAPVAAPLHRVLAGALDAGLILIAFTVFAVLFRLIAGPVVLGKISIPVFASTFALIAVLYGLLWTIAGRESTGMRTLQLKLINFDGFPPDARSRALRLCGTTLSFCSGGLGLFWVLLDEENLGWHDHMSKTFPTIDEGHGFLKTRSE